MSLADTAVIILTKNGGELFADVLSGLFSCEGIGEAEVLIIDSGSSDRTLEYAARYPQIRTHKIPPSEFGHGKTRNLGASLTNRPILVYLVQDATPATPDFLHRLTAPLREKGFAGVYGRQLARTWTNKIERVFLENTYPDRREVRSYSGSKSLCIHDIFFSNVCSAILRNVWEQIHFDESLIMSEDQMWAKQSLLAGHRLLYEPTATVFHSHNYRLREVFKRNFDSGASLVGIVEGNFAEMARYEFSHISSSINSFWSSGELLQIPYLFVFEFVRAIGFATGQRAHRLPCRLKQLLSIHKYHWATHGKTTIKL